MQLEGYETKRGKYISARAPDQERFTRLKTLGVDYTEEALAARIAGHARPSRQPKQRSGTPSLLIDIQNNLKAQQSAGYRHWATIENLKRIAETTNFLTEHHIHSYADLLTDCQAAENTCAEIKNSLRDTETSMKTLALEIKYAAVYRQLKPIYDRYRASRDPEKYLRGHESDLILFESRRQRAETLGRCAASNHRADAERNVRPRCPEGFPESEAPTSKGSGADLRCHAPECGGLSISPRGRSRSTRWNWNSISLGFFLRFVYNRIRRCLYDQT